MFLGFDIGNTSTVMGIYQDANVMPARIFRYDTDRVMTEADLTARIKQNIEEVKAKTRLYDGISGFAFTSVVPSLNPLYHAVCRNLFTFDAYEISHKSTLPVSINYDDPAQLGVDRIVNAVSTFSEYGGPAIIVDIGTAATFCVLLKDGTFDGGLIAPGIGTTINALAANTSQLPVVDFGPPDSLVARDTVNAIKSGFFYGWLSMVDGIVSRIEDEYGFEFQVILTGGYAPLLARHLSGEPICDPFLTMKGIKIIHDMNHS